MSNYYDAFGSNKGFVRTFQNTGNVLEKFDARLRCGIIDHVTVTDKENTIFTFKTGIELKVAKK